MPVTLRAGLMRLATRAVVSSNLPMPCRARKCGCKGMNTSLAADRALSVSTPSDGPQSMNTKSNEPSSCSSRSRRMTSRPTTPASSTSAAARLMSEAATQRLSATLRRTSASGREWTSTSYIDGDLPSGSMPRAAAAWRASIEDLYGDLSGQRGLDKDPAVRRLLAGRRRVSLPDLIIALQTYYALLCDALAAGSAEEMAGLPPGRFLHALRDLATGEAFRRLG